MNFRVRIIEVVTYEKHWRGVSGFEFSIHHWCSSWYQEPISAVNFHSVRDFLDVYGLECVLEKKVNITAFRKVEGFLVWLGNLRRVGDLLRNDEVDEVWIKIHLVILDELDREAGSGDLEKQFFFASMYFNYEYRVEDVGDLRTSRRSGSYRIGWWVFVVV